MKEKSYRIFVPIYDVTLELVVTDDIIKSQKREPRYTNMGKQDPTDFRGLAMWSGGRFCIILDRKSLDNSLIAHEAFHVTHRIMKYTGAKFKVNNHEPFANLNGYINQLIYNQLKKWKIRVK